MNPDITFGCGLYMPFFALALGKVSVPGVTVRYLPSEPRSMFAEMLAHERFDVSEMSMMSYVGLVERGDRRFIGIPVFPSRLFRYTAVYVRSGGPVRTADDLRGRRVGIAGYGQSAAVWVRGFLQERYGVSPSEITWVVERGSRETLRPPGVEIVVEDSDASVETLLERGDVDALVSPWAPASYLEGIDAHGRASGAVVRLFSDVADLEREDLARYGIPLMHTVIVRASVAERIPGLPLALYRALCASRDVYLEGMLRTNVSHLGLPFESTQFQSALDASGPAALWPYGSEPNAASLDAFLRLAHEQGLTSRRVERSELYSTDFDTVPESVWRGDAA